jgi:hypothetical protein
MAYNKYLVFIPLRKEVVNVGTKRAPKIVDTEDQIRQITSEWKTYKHQTSVRYIGSRWDLSAAGSGDVIFVQAHGYRNSPLSIGADWGVQEMSPRDLFEKMTRDGGLKIETINLTIKLWTCFSGFDFAKEFYDVAHSGGTTWSCRARLLGRDSNNST